MCAAWVPLENNPDVLNTYMNQLGVADTKLEFVDVYGVSEELLAMVPQPVHAVLFVFPVTPVSEQEAKELTNTQKEEADRLLREHAVFYTKQYTDNACGTIAMLHALFNNVEWTTPFAPGSVLASLFTQVVETHMSPSDAGAAVRDCEALEREHSLAAAAGMTAQPDDGTPVDLHFVCFVCANGRCVELDGRQANPILHGPCATNGELLSAAASVMKHRMESLPNSFEFSITALVSGQD